MPRKTTDRKMKSRARRLRLELLEARVADQRYARRAERALARSRWQDPDYRRLLLEKLNLDFAAELSALDEQVLNMEQMAAGLPPQNELEFRYATGEWAGLRGSVD